MAQSFVLILVAGGSGQRLGASMPKQFLQLGGKPVWRHSFDSIVAHPACRGSVLVFPEGWCLPAGDPLGDVNKPAVSCVGGASRFESVAAGVNTALRSGMLADYAFIHDAARPFVSSGTLDRLLAQSAPDRAVAPAISLADALKRVRGHSVEGAVNRDDVRAVQTPQVMPWAILTTAYASADHGEAVDDLEIAARIGLQCQWIEGSPQNYKITTQDDWARAVQHTEGRLETVTGSGFDVHRLAEGGKMWLCGVELDEVMHLVGHSDADVGLHALTDAVLGAAGLGDIGDHFPPSDPQWRGASSDTFLTFAIGAAKAHGWELAHLDVTLICERPKIKPHRDAMRERLSEITGLSVERCSLKATTTEGLGFTGRGEGIAAQAIVTLKRERAHYSMDRLQ